MQNVTFENVSGTNFHINGFACTLVLTQRQKATRKWPIQSASKSSPDDQIFESVGEDACEITSHKVGYGQS